MVGNASVVEAFRDFGDQFYYLRQQIIWGALGLVAFAFFSFFDYRRLRKFVLPLILFSFIALILVLIPGLGIKVLGARRWLSLGFFRFQPAEFTKLAFVLYLSSFFANKRNFWPFLSVLAALLLLIMLEPDLGTAVILASTSLVVYFVSGAAVGGAFPSTALRADKALTRAGSKSGCIGFPCQTTRPLRPIMKDDGMVLTEYFPDRPLSIPT